MTARVGKPVRVEPIGKRDSIAFVDYTDGRGALERIAVNEYPHSPRGEQLREARVHESDLTLRDAARLLDMRVVEYSGLETGSYTLATDAEWDFTIDKIRKARR